MTSTDKGKRTDKDQKAYMEEMREHWEKLKAFISAISQTEREKYRISIENEYDINIRKEREKLPL